MLNKKCRACDLSGGGAGLCAPPPQSLDLKEQLGLQVKQLTLDCDMLKEKSSVMQSQMRELQGERDQVRPRPPSGVAPPPRRRGPRGNVLFT